MSRKNTPEIENIDELLPPVVGKSGRPEVKKSGRPPADEKKIKNTISLTPLASHRLEDVQLELKRSLGKHVNKSDVLEIAFLMAYEEYEFRGLESELAKRMSRLLDV